LDWFARIMGHRAITLIDTRFQFVTTGTSHFPPRGPYVLIGLGAILLAFLWSRTYPFRASIVRQSRKASGLRDEAAALLQR